MARPLGAPVAQHAEIEVAVEVDVDELEAGEHQALVCRQGAHRDLGDTLLLVAGVRHFEGGVLHQAVVIGVEHQTERPNRSRIARVKLPHQGPLVGRSRDARRDGRACGHRREDARQGRGPLGRVEGPGGRGSLRRALRLLGRRGEGAAGDRNDQEAPGEGTKAHEHSLSQGPRRGQESRGTGRTNGYLGTTGGFLSLCTQEARSKSMNSRTRSCAVSGVLRHAPGKVPVELRPLPMWKLE